MVATLGLFHRAIIQSGSALCDWSIEKDPLDYTKSIAVRMKCPSSDSDAMIKCLRGRSTQQLIGLQKELQVLSNER